MPKQSINDHFDDKPIRNGVFGFFAENVFESSEELAAYDRPNEPKWIESK